MKQKASKIHWKIPTVHCAAIDAWRSLISGKAYTKCSKKLIKQCDVCYESVSASHNEVFKA